LGAGFFLILLIIFLVPAFLSSKAGNKIILSKINDSIDGKVGFSALSIGWCSGVKIDKLNFTDLKGQTSVAVRKITTHPRYLSILMGNLLLGETTIDEPRIEVSVKDAGEKKTTAGTYLPAEKSSDSKGFAIAKINVLVNNGNLKVVGKDGKTVELTQINSKLDIKGPGKQTSFDIDMHVNDSHRKSRITVEGMVRLGLSKGKLNWQKTDGDIKAKIDEFDLETIGILLAAIGKEFDAGGKLKADIDVKIEDGRFEKLSAKAVLSEFKRKLAGKEATLDEPVKLDVAISSDKKDVKIDRLTIESSFCKVRCSGGINSVEYNATAELGGLQDFLSQFMDFGLYSMAGDIAANGKLTFDASCIKTTGQADLKNVSIQSSGTKEKALISGQIPFDIEIDTNKNLFYIESLELRSIDKQRKVEIKNSVVPLGEQAKEKLKLNIAAELDLQKVQPLASVFVPFPKSINFAGKIKSTLSVREQSGGYHIVADRVELQGFEMVKSGKKTFEEQLVKASVDIVYKDKNAIEVNKLQLDSSRIKVVDGKLKKQSRKGMTKVEGQLECEYDWEAVSDIISAFLPEGFQLEGKRKDSIKFSSSYLDAQGDKFLSNLSTQSKVGFEKAEYMGLEFGKTDIDIQIENGLLKISPFTTVVNDGKLNFAGQVNFNRKPAIFTTPGQIKIVENIQINDKMSKKLLTYMNPVFADAVNVTGMANFDCEKLSIPLASDSINDLEIIGVISMDRMRLEASDLLAQILMAAGSRAGEDMAIRPTKFTVQNGFLRYDDMQMDVGRNSINFKGVIGLADKSLDMKVAIPYKGGKKVSVPLRGTIDKPELDLAGLLGETLQQQLEDELKEKLGEELGEEVTEKAMEVLEELFK